MVIRIKLRFYTHKPFFNRFVHSPMIYIWPKRLLEMDRHILHPCLMNSLKLKLGKPTTTKLFLLLDKCRTHPHEQNYCQDVECFCRLLITKHNVVNSTLQNFRAVHNQICNIFYLWKMSISKLASIFKMSYIHDAKLSYYIV